MNYLGNISLVLLGVLCWAVLIPTAWRLRRSFLVLGGVKYVVFWAMFITVAIFNISMSLYFAMDDPANAGKYVVLYSGLSGGIFAASLGWVLVYLAGRRILRGLAKDQ